MQLVEERRVDLDAKVRTYLPRFRLQSEADAARLTVRDLVTHHTGYVGDYFRDTGRGDDAIALIVAKMANSPQLVPAGTVFSYSNAAFYVLAHIVETMRGKPFEEVIRERVFEPLGMHDVVLLSGRVHDLPRRVGPHRHERRAEDRAALAHVAQRRRRRRRDLERRSIRCVTRRCTSARSTRQSVLSRDSVALMQRVQRPAGSMCESIGISWMLDDAGSADSASSNTAAPPTASCRRSK